MHVFDPTEMAEVTGGRLLAGGPAGPVATDTRGLPKDAWFLALRGERFDAHEFLGQARAAGAVGCIVDRVPSGDWEGGVLLVDDTLRALQDLAASRREMYKGSVVGITGSSGKTTTRSLCALALRPLGSVHETEGNWNNHVGLPLTILAAGGGERAWVLELGTSSPGEIERLTEICSPDVRVVLNVGPAHLEELGGLDGVAREKGALFASARPGDVVCINMDDPWVSAMVHPAGVHRVSWGTVPGATIRLVESTLDTQTLTTRARYATPDGEFTVRIADPGHHVALDGAGALAAAFALGAPLRESVEAMAAYEPVGMRLAVEQMPGGWVAINDAYNANPQSMAASLNLLAKLPPPRVAVLGDMLELGESESEWHAQVACTAGELGLEGVVLVGPRMMRAAPNCRGASEVFACEDPLDAVAWLEARLAPQGTVLFKASRGLRVERILDALREVKL
jgi:UDP-N-acetylmuramoyl-tripeptide--D-alanyl-D-alanine ligase